MKSLQQLVNRYKNQQGERLGQFFCNRYVKQSWPELFYEKDESKAIEMIRSWLASHHYTDQLPQFTENWKQHIAKEYH